jgi:hypothetical protein
MYHVRAVGGRRGTTVNPRGGGDSAAEQVGHERSGDTIGAKEPDLWRACRCFLNGDYPNQTVAWTPLGRG